ncbi:MAG TPA: HAMP domain-containing sensor histidine kinase [Pararhizobium sp.]|nr:HAMP domain-containing sensor histidine kinase [Pararhizobium sp.]
MAEGEPKAGPAAEPFAERPVRSLSRKLLLLTVLFVMIAEVLIFVPSVAFMRVRWLQNQLNRAAGTSVIIDGLQGVHLPKALQKEALMATGAMAIALRKDGATRLIASSSDMPSEVTLNYDLAKATPFSAIIDAFDTLFFGGDRAIRVYGPVGDGMVIDMVLDDTGLRHAMLIYARNVLILSLILSLITASLVFFAIRRTLIRPIQEMSNNMRAFSEAPEDASRIIAPDARDDEIGFAKRHLAAMETELHRTLKQQKNLADLGLAVSKINHDMRNILSSAQLMSDRLSTVDDPVVKRLAPKLLRAIDRAVGYTREVMAYGRTREAEPRRRYLKLAALVKDVQELLTIDRENGIDFISAVPPDLEVEADSEQLFRVIHNLVRNAYQAMQGDDRSDPALIRRVTVSAERHGGVVTILVDDTGPGMPAKARENLFAPFRGSARAGGTGLGLAIARELVIAHGGSIDLIDKEAPGTTFRVTLPDQPVDLRRFRSTG